MSRPRSNPGTSPASRQEKLIIRASPLGPRAEKVARELLDNLRRDGEIVPPNRLLNHMLNRIADAKNYVC